MFYDYIQHNGDVSPERYSMTFAQRRNRLTTHFSERIPVVKRRMTLHRLPELHSLTL